MKIKVKKIEVNQDIEERIKIKRKIYVKRRKCQMIEKSLLKIYQKQTKKNNGLKS